MLYVHLFNHMQGLIETTVNTCFIKQDYRKLRTALDNGLTKCTSVKILNSILEPVTLDLTIVTVYLLYLMSILTRVFRSS